MYRGVTIHLVTIRFVLWYTACDTLHDTIFAIHISDILFIQELSIGERKFVVRLVTACSVIIFLDIKRYQTFIVLKEATHVVFVYKSLLHWCFDVLILYSKPVLVWFSVWFLPLEQVSFLSIQEPAIRYAYRKHSGYDFSIFRLIVTPLLMYICMFTCIITWSGSNELTHLPLDKMATISQMTFSNAFSWMKSFIFWFEFHRSLFLGVQLTISEHWFG